MTASAKDHQRKYPSRSLDVQGKKTQSILSETHTRARITFMALHSELKGI